MPKPQTLPDTIFDLAAKVHDIVGPGLDAPAYTKCLCIELEKAGIQFKTEVPIPIVYDGTILPLDYHADLVVENRVVVQVKAVDAFNAEHDQEIYTFVRMGHFPDGLLLNFNTVDLKDGVRRFAV